jgi:N-acetylmuramic acid 6-phosphate etherase
MWVCDVGAGKDGIVHVHFNDAPKLPPDQIRDNERLMPGEGVINLNAFLMALHEIGYQDALSVEVFGRGLKDMTPEAGARLGLETSLAVMRKAASLKEALEKMLENLLTEQVNPASEGIDALPTARILEIINAEDRQVADAVAREIPAIARAVDAIVAAMRAGGRLFYIGAGTSGRLGVLDAAECPPTFGARRTGAGHHGGRRSGAGARHRNHRRRSGHRRARPSRTRLHRARRAGGDRRQRPHAVRARRGRGSPAPGRRHGGHQLYARFGAGPRRAYRHHAADRPEILAGSTRMKAGTATKLVLNMLSTAVFIRLGYVYGNLMVNVQPKNSKLIDRARRIVARAAGVTYEAAGELLAPPATASARPSSWVKWAWIAKPPNAAGRGRRARLPGT